MRYGLADAIGEAYDRISKEPLELLWVRLVEATAWLEVKPHR